MELLVATIVFSLAFIGLLLSFVKSMELHEASRNTSYALSAVRSRIEVIKNTAFDQIVSTYDEATFTDANLNGIGVSYIDNSDPDLLEVTVSFAWIQKNGRVVGEDQDLDGVLDAGEDTDLNNVLSSPAQAVTYIYDRG